MNKVPTKNHVIPIQNDTKNISISPLSEACNAVSKKNQLNIEKSIPSILIGFLISFFIVIPTGLEPVTSKLEVLRTIQLCYGIINPTF